MSNAAIDERTNPSWYRKGNTGNAGGRPSIKWLREKVETVDPETGQTKLQDMADHLIEVATKWEIIQRGESVPVASARDSVEACRLLWQALSLIRKTPPSEEEQVLKLAEHLQSVSRDQVDIGLKLLGNQLATMTDEKKVEFWARCEKDPMRFLEAAKAVTDGAAESGTAQIEAPPQAQAEDLTVVPSTVELGPYSEIDGPLCRCGVPQDGHMVDGERVWRGHVPCSGFVAASEGGK